MIQDNLLSYLSRWYLSRSNGLETFAGDLENFSNHAGREEVTVRDVVLCTTKSVELVCACFLHFECVDE